MFSCIYLTMVVTLTSCLYVANDVAKESLSYFYPRVDFIQRIEPRGNKILFGVNPSYSPLSATPTSTRAHPAYFAYSFNLRELRSNWYRLIQDLLTRSNYYDLLQIDIHILTPEGQCYGQAISDGFLNDQLDALGHGLRQIRRPTILRFAPEFNAIWSTCSPQEYKDAWRRLGEVIRHRWKLRHVATAWTLSGDGHPKIMEYFPGDEYVDWWSLEVHTPRELQNITVNTAMQFALENGYPILLGASTPLTKSPRTSEDLWSMWFEPLLSLVRKQPLIKAFTYNDWIDLDTSGDPVIAEQFYLELSNPIYQLAGDYETLNWLLDLDYTH